VAKGFDFPSLVVTDETILEEFGIHKGQIAVLKGNFAAVFEGELTTKNLYEFVRRNKL